MRCERYVKQNENQEKSGKRFALSIPVSKRHSLSSVSQVHYLISMQAKRSVGFEVDGGQDDQGE